MVKMEVSPQGIQCRYSVFDGSRLVCQFVKENEAQAYLMQLRKAKEKVRK